MTGKTFEYRADGEMTKRGADAINWDGWGRHTGGSFGPTPQTIVSYQFDPVGFRRRRESGGQITHYRLAGLFETNSAEQLQQTDVDGPAGDLARYAGPPTTQSSATYLFYNGHGDLAAGASQSGTRTSAESYDPFGAPTQSQPGDKTLERFTGRWDKKLDTTSSLVEMGARPYDPSLGRFLSIDPIDGGSLNAYEYAGQDPVNGFDLDGLKNYRGTGGGGGTAGSGGAGGGFGGAGTGSGGGGGKVPPNRPSQPGSKGGPGAGKRFSPKTGEDARADANARCEYCGRKTTRKPGPRKGETDHIVPKSKGGTNNRENAAHACRTCNRKKSNKSLDDWAASRPG